ncbi:hypothetical protein [Flagellimonas sp.]|uniref:hypothetical protein n=1 Tax=Flagellimonas sp. TaxID=2058762 RepID=UPI003F4A79A5
MEKTKKNKQYQEWFSADEMHQESKRWLSQLAFIKDEQKFLDNIVKDYTLDVLDGDFFQQVKDSSDALLTSKKNMQLLHVKIRLHENQLIIMLDDIDQIKMESAYLETHKRLAKEMVEHMEKYEVAKLYIFKVISEIMKKRKRKKLLG